MLAIAAVTVPLVLLAAAANAPEDLDAADPTRELFDDVDRPSSTTMALDDPRYRGALKDRVRHHTLMIAETGGDGAINSGMLRTGIRTKLNQLRSKDGVSKPGLDVMQQAGALAQQVAQERQYHHMTFPGRQVRAATEIGRTRPEMITYLGIPSVVPPTPFVRQVSNEARPSTQYASNDVIDRNRLKWLTDPFSVGNPLMAFNKTRAPPSNAAPGSTQLAPITPQEISRLAPRPGRGRGKTRGRGGRAVQFAPGVAR